MVFVYGVVCGQKGVLECGVGCVRCWVGQCVGIGFGGVVCVVIWCGNFEEGMYIGIIGNLFFNYVDYVFCVFGGELEGLLVVFVCVEKVWFVIVCFILVGLYVLVLLVVKGVVDYYVLCVGV